MEFCERCIEEARRLGIEAVTLAVAIPGGDEQFVRPSSPSDDQCHTIADEGRGMPTRLRAAAERIAKGEGF